MRGPCSDVNAVDGTPSDMGATGGLFILPNFISYDFIFKRECFPCVCKKYDVEFRCFKYISDKADENAASDWNENIRKGNQLFQELLYNGKI